MSSTQQAPVAGTGLTTADAAAEATVSRSLTSDAWHELRRRPVFWFGAVIVLLLILIALFPKLFTSADPLACKLTDRFGAARDGAPFGFDQQGCNVYSRAIHGARASLEVGLFSTLMAGVIGMVLGTAAGYFGGWVDALLSRMLDIVLGIPLLLAAIVLLRRLSSSGNNSGIVPVILALGLLSWTTPARIIRSSVIAAKQQDYVQAARMLGANNLRVVLRHILPNAIAPMVVVMTIMLGTLISTEAALSFLGIGLRPPTISWGSMIDSAAPYIRTAPGNLLWPAGFLATTVLAFVMLGDAVRDAFDPRMR